MDAGQHYHSFTDHLSLYLPPFLRPSLPRDLRPPPLPQSRDPQQPPSLSVPPSTPEPSEIRGRAGVRLNEEVVSDIDPTLLNDRYQDSETQKGRKSPKEKSIPPSESQVEEASAKSKEGYSFALVLTNTGSVARDHLALERTFLAYVRTSLAMASTGVALVQLLTIASNFGQNQSAHQQFVGKFATPLGATLILFALTILLLGGLRYFAIQFALTRGVFPAARLTVGFIVVVGVAVTGTAFSVLIKGRGVK